MEFSLNRNEMRRRVIEQGQAAIEARQVARRMRELLQARLQQLLSEHRKQGSVAQARRKALTDPRYRDYIEQVVDVCSKAQAARIRHETYLMYYEVM